MILKEGSKPILKGTHELLKSLRHSSFPALPCCPVSGDTRATMSSSTKYTLNILRLDASIRCSGTSSLIILDWPCRLEWVVRRSHAHLKSTFLLMKVAGATLPCSRLASTYGSALNIDTGQGDTPARPLETGAGVRISTSHDRKRGDSPSRRWYGRFTRSPSKSS